MAACDQAHHVSPYLDGELSPHEAARFKAHLRNCPHCQEAISEIRQVDEALRQQARLQPSRLSDCSESIADSVQRELTRSGQFSRARRANFLLRHRRQLLTGLVGIVLLSLALVVSLHLLSGGESPASNNAAAGAPHARPLDQPELASLLGEAEALLSQLQRDAAQPGAALRLRDEARRSAIRERLLAIEANLLGPPDHAMEALDVALSHLVNLPEDNPERRARLLAAAVTESRLLEQVAELRQRHMWRAH
jgi:hypothetical protein